MKKTCLCVNFSPTGEKLTFSGLFHLEVKKHTLGKIVKNHQTMHLTMSIAVWIIVVVVVVVVEVVLLLTLLLVELSLVVVGCLD